MPWSGKEFNAKNKKLSPANAKKAAAQANAILRSGAPEGVAIATANKFADKRAEHMDRRKKQGTTYRELAGEFGTSKSTAHRTVQKQDMLRQGFIKGGSAQ